MNIETSDAHNAYSDDEKAGNESLPRRFERLFRQQNQSLVRMLNAQLHDAEAAREVAQEAYEEVFKRDKAGTLEQLGAATVAYLRNYLFKTARNIATDRLRQRARRLRDAHLISLHGQREDAPSAESLCIQHEDWECLQKAVQELPGKCRQAFKLVELDCLPIAVVAQQMGVKPNTVYQLCKRAYEHLMFALSEKDSAQGDSK